jgi:BON domain
VKRKPTSSQGKPVLDEGAFQQLLAAIYILQEHHDRLLEKEAKADCTALSDGAIAENVRPIQQLVPLMPERVAVPVLPLEPVIPVAQADVEPLALQNDSVIPPGTAYQLSVLASQLEALIEQRNRTDSEWTTRLPVAVAREIPAEEQQAVAYHAEGWEKAGFEQPQSEPAHLIPLVQRVGPGGTSILPHRIVRRRNSQSNELFLRTATVVAIAALLGASFHRFSPLPGGLALNRLHATYGSKADVVTGDTAQVVSEVQNRIRADRRLQMTRVQVRASNRTITLSGDVGNGAERVAAVQDAAQIEGVKVVVNNLRVIDPNRQSPTAVQASVVRTASRSKAPTSPRAGVFHVAVPARSLRRPAPEIIGARSSRSTTASPTSVAPAASISSDAHSMDSKASGVSASTPSPAVPPPLRAPEQVTVPYGTVLAVQLTESVNSDLNHPGDTFRASLASPIMVGDRVVIPAEAAIQGKIVDVRNARRFNGRSALVIKVTRLAYNGRTYELRSSQYSKEAVSRNTHAAAAIGGGAGVGAVIGAIP